MPVNVIGTIKPKNNGKFPVAEAVDIKVTDDLRLDKALEKKADLETIDFALDNKADKATTTSLQSQINEIITPVTQDAEVQNARVSISGSTYTTLKERLDTEYTRITNVTNEIQLSDIILEQGGIDSSDGSTTDSTTRLRTQNYIYGTFDLRVNREHWVIRQVAYYNVSDLSFNSGESINSGSAVIGKTDCIAKISFGKTDNSNVTVSDLKRSTDFETLSSIVKYGESISANTDINNITKIGIYRYTDSTSNVSNLPVARSGKLIVSAGTSASNSRAIQTFYPYWNTIKGDYYIRSLISTGWTEWYKYEGKPISEEDVDLDKYPKWYLFQSKMVVAPSAITIINNKLYVFCYTALNEETSNNTIYTINKDGTIGSAERHFNSTIGHQNTVDYNEYNDCLIASRYDEISESAGIFSMYIFKNASALRHFYVEECMEIPLNDMLPGNTSLNCVWGDNNAGKNDIIYATSRDRELQKRYITRIQLGKGSNNLGSGTIIPDCPDDEFNGTFKIQKSFEIPWGGESGVTEGTNDMCFYNGKIYRGMNEHNSFSEHEIVDFDTTFSTKKIKIPMYNDEGTEIDVEPEGITIYNHILYFATGDKLVHVIKWD